MASLLEQLPHLSQYDMTGLPEGGLDPLGLAAVADRLAELYAPGVRVRMSQPRFVTLSAIGALACAHLRDVEPADGVTTFDLAFEWVVVEALVRHAPAEVAGLPGSRKASTAVRRGERLSARSYLSGPRVNGFTGVYRPFSLSARVLGESGGVGDSADRLLRAWEASSRARLRGFVDAVPGSPGRALRDKIAGAVRDSLRAGKCAAPKSGWMSDLAPLVTPRGARVAEQSALRTLVAGDAGGLRHELVAILDQSGGDARLPEHELAARLDGASPRLRLPITAAADYEVCATMLDNTFRRLLRHGGASGGLVRRGEAEKLDFLASTAPRVVLTVDQAIRSAEAVDEGLAHTVADVLSLFQAVTRPATLLDGLLDRHEAVQADKGKRSWLDPVHQDWYVRSHYQDQSPPDDDTHWVHPMRLTTLMRFLEATR